MRFGALKQVDPVRPHQDETPKRNPKRRLTQLGNSPVTPAFTRQLREIFRKDAADGWVDQGSSTRTALGPRESAEAMQFNKSGPTKSNIRPVTPKNYRPLRRALFPASTAKPSKQGDRLSRIQMECIQLKQENERLRSSLTQPTHKTDELIAEIIKRDDYIEASQHHHQKVLETIKARQSAELARLQTKLERFEEDRRKLQMEKTQLEATIDALRDRHAHESQQLIVHLSTYCCSLIVFYARNRRR